MDAAYSPPQGKLLLDIARGAIEDRLHNRVCEKGQWGGVSFLKEKRGAFVTLSKQGALRGCIGSILPNDSLDSCVRENALKAAFNDPRFSPVSRGEMAEIRIEVSVLSVPSELILDYPRDILDRVVPFEDGVILKKGERSATFLPQVWEQLADPVSFFSHLCLKAGLGEREWLENNLEVYTYRVQAFSEDEK